MGRDSRRNEQERARWDKRERKREDREEAFQRGRPWLTVPALSAPANPSAETVPEPDVTRLLDALGMKREITFGGLGAASGYHEETWPELVNRAVFQVIPGLLARSLEYEGQRNRLYMAELEVRRLRACLALSDGEREAERVKREGKTPAAIGPRRFFDEG